MMLLQVFVIVSSITSTLAADPQGSTGCSGKYPFSGGWCWRYCAGSSGSWCYTGSGCYSAFYDKNEVCATKTTCAKTNCRGAAAGCVTSCQNNQLPQQEQYSNQPVGSTGCSQKYVFGRFDGWCWRYCEGSSGDWCYTGDCKDNPESCANKRTCGGYNCIGAAQGCVRYCTTRRQGQVVLYSDVGYQGQSYRYSNVNKCLNLPYHFEDKTSSVQTHGSCIRIFEHRDCTGNSLRILGNGNNNLGQRSFRGITSSIGPCLAEDIQCTRSGNVFERQAGGICGRWYDMFRFGPLQAFNLLRARMRQSGVNYLYQTGGMQQVLYGQFNITRDSLNRGSGTTQQTRDFARRLGRSNDDAGHILANRLGGSGDVVTNIFPQSRSFNRGVWRTRVENVVYEHVQRDGSVTFEVRLLYDLNASRPSSILYMIRFRDGTYRGGIMDNP